MKYDSFFYKFARIIFIWRIMVKKRLVFLLVYLFSMALLNAQETRKHVLSADVTAQGLVGFNNTYKWYGGADLKGVFHVDNTDFHLDFEALTKNVYSMGLSVRQGFEVCRNGLVFIDWTLHSRIFGNYDIYEFVYAAGTGFRMRHFSVQLGCYMRTVGDLHRNLHALGSRTTEPFNPLYMLTISIMGFDNPWDVYLTGANFNEFEYERMWAPLCTLGGRWDFKDRWSMVAEGTLKPSGMFHATVKFYEVMLRIGVFYKL